MPTLDVEHRQKTILRNSDRRSWIQNHNLSSILDIKLKTLHRNRECAGSKLQRQISDLKQEVKDRKEEQKVCRMRTRSQISSANILKQRPKSSPVRLNNLQQTTNCSTNLKCINLNCYGCSHKIYSNYGFQAWTTRRTSSAWSRSYYRPLTAHHSNKTPHHAWLKRERYLSRNLG